MKPSVIKFILVLAIIFPSCTNKMEEAKKLINDKKSEEAISLLSQIEPDDERYSEAKNLIRIEKSKIANEKGLENFFAGDYEESLKYFSQVEDEGESFPNLNKSIKETKIALELIKFLPGTYKGSATTPFAGAYMITNNNMEILRSLNYNIQEQTTDTYSGRSFNEFYSGIIEPRITEFKSSEYGLILNLRPFGDPYRTNEYSVYFYRYEEYWRLQFNLIAGTNQGYTLNLFRKADKNDTYITEKNKEITNTGSNNNNSKEYFDPVKSSNLDFLKDFNGSRVEFLSNPIIKKRLQNLIGNNRFDFLVKNFNVQLNEGYIEDDILYFEACEPHNCVTNSLITADISQNIISVGITENKKIDIISEDKNKLPEIFDDWYASIKDNIELLDSLSKNRNSDETIIDNIQFKRKYKLLNTTFWLEMDNNIGKIYYEKGEGYTELKFVAKTKGGKYIWGEYYKGERLATLEFESDEYKAGTFIRLKDNKRFYFEEY